MPKKVIDKIWKNKLPFIEEAKGVHAFVTFLFLFNLERMSIPFHFFFDLFIDETLFWWKTNNYSIRDQNGWSRKIRYQNWLDVLLKRTNNEINCSLSLGSTWGGAILMKNWNIRDQNWWSQDIGYQIDFITCFGNQNKNYPKKIYDVTLKTIKWKFLNKLKIIKIIKI